MKKPRLLDLFCGAGGASMGYHRAGFEVVGVDVNPQKNYPFEFHQADALTYPLEGFDAIHASPPCQAFCAGFVPNRERHADLIHQTRERLNTTGIPWVIENVRRAPIRADFILFGWMFGLPLERRRHFETNWEGMDMSPGRSHFGPTVCIAGRGTPTGTYKRLGRALTIKEKQDAMGIDWCSTKGLAQAIPPAYTEFIGKALISMLTNGKSPPATGTRG